MAYIIDTTLKKDAEGQLIEQKVQVERLITELAQKVAERTQALMTTLEQLQSALDQGTTVTLTLPYDNHPAD